MDSRTQLLNDPFWSVVAARHPELEIVLLPPEAPGATGPDVSISVLDATADQVAEMVALVDGHRPALGLDQAAPERHAEVVPGPEPDTVEVRLKHTGPDPDGAEILALIERSADHAVRRDGEVIRLAAAFDLIRVHASWAAATEMLVVRATSPALRVGAEVAARLLGRA